MRVHVYRPDGIARPVEFDEAVPEEPTFRSWPERPEDWKDGLVSRIAHRVEKLWEFDVHHPWHGVGHFSFGLVYYHEKKECSYVQ